MRFRIPTILAALLLCSPSTSHAQTTGRVSGRVLDQTGAALPGVAIDLVVNSRELTAVTDDTGAYRFDAVPAGSAELTFRLLNFSVLRRSVSVTNGASVNADVVLTLSLSADVIVTGARTFRNVADVEDPAANLVGIAASASQGAVTAAQIDERPIMRAGEVLETVPGLVVSQHSGEGKANQYYLRGFNLDHGTDFSTTVAGVPVNTPTGAHAHGYSDVSFLIPELVSGVQFKKGPYFADEGDFSAAGAANINYVNQLERPIVRASGGNDGWGRLFGAASPRVGRRISAWRARGEPQRRAVGATGRLPQDQWRPALQPRRQSQRVLADRHGLLGRLGFDRPGPGTRHHRGADSAGSVSSMRVTAGRRTARASPPSISIRMVPRRCVRPASCCTTA